MGRFRAAYKDKKNIAPLTIKRIFYERKRNKHNTANRLLYVLKFKNDKHDTWLLK